MAINTDKRDLLEIGDDALNDFESCLTYIGKSYRYNPILLEEVKKTYTNLSFWWELLANNAEECKPNLTVLRPNSNHVNQ